MQGEKCLWGRLKFGMKAKADKRKKKRTALVLCRSGKQFWTTQAEFWQWVRDHVVIKTRDHPPTGIFRREDEELTVLLNHTLLNLAAPNHMRETLLSRRMIKRRQ
jgi:hypothetical protein